MTVKIGINGFGRIGRLAFRRIFELQARGGQAGDIEVAAINDLTTPSMLAYLLKYDSTHGTFRHDDGTPVEVTSTDDSIVVDGKEYKVYAEKDANNIPWVKNDGVEFVLECTGFYTSAEKSQAHINAGAKKVLISAPAKDETTPTIVFGVNHETLKASDVIVSAGSCTTNSMAAMVKLLDENWGIKAGFMTTIHAYTGTQMILDGPRFPKARNNRAAAINTIPHSTGAAKAIGKVVPSVNGKLQGHAQRIQVPDGSVTELTTALIDAVRREESAGTVERFPHHKFRTLLFSGNICGGCTVQDTYTGELLRFVCDAVLIATGGPHGLFGDTTGSLANTGEVTAELFRLGVPMANLEMIQYHPTTVEQGGKRMLLSEAARGEGGRLLALRNGKPWYFMEEKYPELGNLMPRDITAREVWTVSRDYEVFLDMIELPKEVMEHKLAGLVDDCQTYLHKDIRKEPIPILPGNFHDWWTER